MDDPHAVRRPAERGDRPLGTTPTYTRDLGLGPRFAIALMVSVTALVTLGALTEEVVHHGPLTGFDVRLMLAFHRDATVRGTGLFEIVTLVGSPRTIAIIGVIMAVVLYLRRQWVLGIGWVGTLLGGGIIDELLKYAIRRPRPPFAAAHLTNMSFSFPSGHAIGSFVGYGMLAYLLLLYLPRPGEAVLLVVAATALILAIGFSRVYLGVHYASDIAGGYAAGAFWLSISVTVTDACYRRAIRRRVSESSPPASGA